MTRRLWAALLIVATVPLAACGPDGAGGGTGSGGGPAGGGGTGGSAHAEACLVGTWAVDVADVARQAAALAKNPSQGTAEGTITMTFGDTLTIHYASSQTIVSPASNGLLVGVKQSYAGDAVSSDYVAKDGKITGTMPADSVTMSTSVIVGGKTQPAQSGKLPGALDISKGLTNYTCSGSSATIANGTVTWKLSKA
jgi:hypothetical protein